MKIIKVTKITLDSFIELKQSSRNYLLINFEDFDRITGYINKKNNFTQRCKKEDIISMAGGFSDNKVFIIICFDKNVGWDKISILEDDYYINEMKFYELANKNGGGQMRFYNGKDII